MKCNFVVDGNGAGAIPRMDKNAAIIGKFTPYPFFILLVNGFSGTSFRTFFCDTFLSLYWWAVIVGGEKLKWRQLAHHQLMSKPNTSFNSTQYS